MGSSSFNQLKALKVSLRFLYNNAISRFSDISELLNLTYDSSAIGMRLQAVYMKATWFQRIWRNTFSVILMIAAGFCLAWSVVYFTGGTKFAHLHVIYIPIILAAFRFNLPGGIAGGFIGTILMGPLMPLDVALQQAQSLENWLSRGGYLIGFGVVIGITHEAILKARDALYQAANYDSVTRLPLYEAFQREVHSVLDDDSLDRHRHTIVNIDLHNAVQIQSSFGSRLYEEVMKASSERIVDVLPADSFIARSGPTRFLALLRDISADEVPEHTSRLINAFETELIAEGIPVHAELKAGVACFPDHGHDVEELVRASHSAMSDGAAPLSHVHFFDRERDASHRQNLELLTELGKAIASGGIYFAAQPKIRLRDSNLIGAELLVRWNHPQQGFIPPDRFIPIAENSRFITAITQSCLSAASEYIQDFQTMIGHSDFRISVNVTGRDVTDAKFPDTLVAAFESNPEGLKQLELEITETAVIEDFGEAIRVLSTLRNMGVHIAIDDFGTGYSSLKYLKDIPADTLKIDQSFVRGVLEFRKDEVLVQETIELARKLGMWTVAEGVETREIADWLHSTGCDAAQGYYFAKPMDPKAWHIWVESYLARPVTNPSQQDDYIDIPAASVVSRA